jgi:hypothetical protein
LKAIISKHNKSIGLSDWKISIENMTAKMSVNNILKKIKIKSESKFGRKEIERLKVHEIGTHVRRYENGKIQGNKIFQSGFPNYLSTEEGLAIYSEHKTELISNRTIRKYALRVLVAAYANKVDFYKLFDYTNNFIDDDEAFSMIVRIKRGLSDTSQLGGYTKDQVYLKGFIEVSKLSSSDIKKLFIGKIGIDELQYFNILETNSNVDYPSWLKQ